MKTIVIGPHPDDELLGCGGTLLKRKKEGDEIAWILVTKITEDGGWSKKEILNKEIQIKNVKKGLGIKDSNFFPLNFETTSLEQIPKSKFINSISKIFNKFLPEEIFIPHPGDAHSDHKVTFEAAAACTKWFRYPSIKKVLTYETLSETDASLNREVIFEPNYYVDINETIKDKCELIKIYEGEISNFPFPRSIKAIKALASVRGSQSGFNAAEAFSLLKYFED